MHTVSLIAAVSTNHVIGRNNQLPWHLPSDLANFRKLTLDKPIIMGRKTFESLGTPLPRRRNIVITRDPFFRAEGVDVFQSVEEGFDFARDIPAEEIMVIGGEQIFEATLCISNRMYLTLVHTIIEDGDAFFPSFEKSEWAEVNKHTLDTNGNEPRAEFLHLERRAV